MRALRSIASGLCAVALLAGCAAPPKRAPGAPIALEQLDRWQARGRIGVSGPDGGGSGSFEWQQRADAASVQIRGPVGIGSVRLEVSGDAEHPDLRLQAGDGAMLESDAAWSELETRLGASLPAGNLRFWLLGLAAPGAHEWQPPADDGSVTLEQQGWRIDYQRYSEDAGAKLPTRLRATSGDARVRIVVDRWQLGE
ncbi:MAG TPA: lipoprotein insertase outer membrane protein LolB [Steroidobacteraceae bacterium]|nr:lipoprotein insertase outer membrane protein LolB [Steroidobacteraceae bacterium]